MPGRDDFPRAGYPNGDPHEMPVDLAAVQADDALLDLIGRGGHTSSDADDELTRVLAAWRREVHAEPFRELVDTNTALEVIHAARYPAHHRSPVFASIAAAAAVLVIAFSSVGLVAKSAQPGDRLWGVTQVLYGDYARSVETAATVRTELNEARTALKEGNAERARASLQRVQKQLPVIGETEGRTDLTARHRQLEQMLNGSPEADSADLPGGPVFPPSVSTGARREPSLSPKSNEPPTSAESTTTSNPTTSNSTTSNPTTEPSNSTTAPRSSRITPGRENPGRGYLAPGGGPAGSGSSDSGSPSGGATTGTDGSAGSGTAGKDSSGSGTTGGTADSAPPNGGPSPSGTPNDNSAGSGPPRRAHARSDAPGCDRADPRPPYCG